MKLTKAQQEAVDSFRRHGGTAWAFTGYRKNCPQRINVGSNISNITILYGKRQAEAYRKRLEKLNVVDGRVVCMSVGILLKLLEINLIVRTKVSAVYSLAQGV